MPIATTRPGFSGLLRVPCRLPSRPGAAGAPPAPLPFFVFLFLIAVSLNKSPGDILQHSAHRTNNPD